MGILFGYVTYKTKSMAAILMHISNVYLPVLFFDNTGICLSTGVYCFHNNWDNRYNCINLCNRSKNASEEENLEIKI